MSEINQWDIWIADFPFEEDATQIIARPVIVLSVEPLWILSVKVTTTSPRTNDIYDIPIVKWKESGLNEPSTARIAKTIGLQRFAFIKQLGVLHPDDRMNIVNTLYNFIKHKHSLTSSSAAVNE